MMARRIAPRRRHHSNGKWKTISVAEACSILHLSERHFYRIRKHLQIKKPGRELLVNEYSVHRYLRNLPDANR